MARNRHPCSHHSHKLEDRRCRWGNGWSSISQLPVLWTLQLDEMDVPHSQLPHRRLQLPLNWNDDDEPWRPRDRYCTCGLGIPSVEGGVLRHPNVQNITSTPAIATEGSLNLPAS